MLEAIFWEASMERAEYKYDVAEFSLANGEEILREQLNLWGAKGWRIVGILKGNTDSPTIIFERTRPAEPEWTDEAGWVEV